MWKAQLRAGARSRNTIGWDAGEECDMPVVVRHCVPWEARVMREMRALGAMIVLAIVAPASAHAGDIVITIDPASIAAAPEGGPTVKVELSDIREKPSLERTALRRSLGTVTLRPGESELVRAIVAAKAAALFQAKPGIAVPETIYCGMRKFVIETPSTIFYWDIKTTVEIVLRVGEQDRVVAGDARERTYIYPTQKLIEKVARQALGKLADGIGPSLTDLAAPPPASSPP